MGAASSRHALASPSKKTKTCFLGCVMTVSPPFGAGHRNGLTSRVISLFSERFGYTAKSGRLYTNLPGAGKAKETSRWLKMARPLSALEVQADTELEAPGPNC